MSGPHPTPRWPFVEPQAPSTHSLCAPPPVVPTIQPGPPTVNASINQTALLPCQVDGAPPPLVSWRKDGATLDPNSPRWELGEEGLRCWF